MISSKVQSCRAWYQLRTQLPQNFLLYNVLQRELWPHVPQEIQGKVITVHCLSNWIFTFRNRSSLAPKTCCPDLCHISDCWSSLIIFYCSRVNLIFRLNVEDLKVLILDKKEIWLQSDQLSTPLRHSLPLGPATDTCRLIHASIQAYNIGRWDETTNLVINNVYSCFTR